MDIKEIALKLLAKEYPGMRQENQAFMVEFAEALISAYKAELLKEVWEPFGHVGKDILGRWSLCRAGEDWKDETAIYTSDQVAAAILKATGPLEDEKNEAIAKVASWQVVVGKVREQLAAAQEENEWLKSEQTELIDRFQNENCGRIHMGEPAISPSIKETVRQWLDIRANEDVAIDIEELVKIAQGKLQEEVTQYKDELAMVLRCSADLRDQLATAEERVAEACASLCDHLQTSQKFGENGYGCEAAIRSGEWRKFVKEM